MHANRGGGGGTDVAGLTNWAGNYAYTASRLLRPGSVDELQELVASASKVKPLGTRHSFTDISDSAGVLVSLDAIAPAIEVDSAARTVSVSAGTSYGVLATALESQGWALANLASLPHISLAGAVSTGTHGSGDRNASLSAAVAALDLVGPDGGLTTLRRGDDDFTGSVVALGALGVVTRLELDIEPTYAVRQEVFTALPWAAVEENLDRITASGYSVSLFTRFDAAQFHQLWVKSRADAPPFEETFGAVPAAAVMHMLEGAPSEALTPQGGVPGPWLERLPHFRMEFTPSRGEEIQSEYLLPRAQAVRALAELRRLAPGFTPVLQNAEVRTVAADDLWLSSSYGCDVVGIHFTWVRDTAKVVEAVGAIEDALLPLGARPHWGKVFRATAAELAPLYPRFADFVALRDRADPNRVFGNDFLDRVLG